MSNTFYNQPVIMSGCLGYYDIQSPQTDRAGFSIAGSILKDGQSVRVIKDPAQRAWQDVSLPRVYMPHPDECLCDTCAADYFAMTREL